MKRCGYWLVTGLLLSLAPSGGWAVDYQKRAEQAPWRWNVEEANLLHCVNRDLRDYCQVEITCPKLDGIPSSDHVLMTVRLVVDGREVYRFRGHSATVLTRAGDVLYLAHFHPEASGCAVTAYDLKAGKQQWRSDLQGIGPVNHSLYENRVTIDAEDGLVVVRGNEAAGRYIEYVDMKTGKTVGHKVYSSTDRDEPPSQQEATETESGGRPRTKATRAVESFRYPEGKHGRGQLKYRNGLPVLVAVGTPEEIGTQIGVLALKPVAARLEELVKGSVQARAGPAWPVLVKVCEALFQKFPAEYRQEVESMARAGGVPRELLIVANTIGDIQHLGGCSVIFVEPARSRTGQLLFGRNWDTPPVGDLDRYGLVIVRRPQGKRAFASITFPGMLMCGSEMNDAGLAMAGNDVRESRDGAPRFNPQGTPMFVLGRRLLEECGSLADAKKALAGVKATTSGSAVLCDAKEGAIFEITPKNIVVRPAEEGIGLCTNHFRTEALATSTQCDRYARLERYRGRAKLGLEDVAKALDEVNQGAWTMQSMIFEPAARRLRVAIGPGPVTKRPLTVLELGPLFSAAGK